jgi:hypothetical protein
VVESNATLDPTVLVQHVSVKSRVHALSRSTGGERTTTTKEGLEGSEGIDIRRGDRKGLECKVNVTQPRKHGAGWWRNRRESDEATSVVSRLSQVESGGLNQGRVKRLDCAMVFVGGKMLEERKLRQKRGLCGFGSSRAADG